MTPAEQIERLLAYAREDVGEAAGAGPTASFLRGRASGYYAAARMIAEAGGQYDWPGYIEWAAGLRAAAKTKEEVPGGEG